jgi:hypothetical protein
VALSGLLRCESAGFDRLTADGALAKTAKFQHDEKISQGAHLESDESCTSTGKLIAFQNTCFGFYSRIK